MFGKLAEAQKQAEEIKQRLEAITLEGIANGGIVRVVANGNRKIKDVIIADELMMPERKEELQDLLLVAIEQALQNAENVAESEMQAMMNAMLPGGLSSLLGKK
jgi:DNA-binding YbaB/EbfC family protein